jgi:hypothetical protein
MDLLLPAPAGKDAIMAHAGRRARAVMASMPSRAPRQPLAANRDVIRDTAARADGARC